MKLTSLDDLFVDQLRDIYSAEKQLVQALPKMGGAASSSKLQEALENHLRITEEQVQRLERIFEELDQSVGRKNKKCQGMQGLIAEGTDLIKEKGEPAVKDAAIIAAAQRIEHYEIAAYGAIRTFAETLGHESIVELLQQTLDEEYAADEALNSLATEEINEEANAPAE